MTAPYQLRPIDEWPGRLTTYRKDSAFRVGIGNTHELLGRELWHLGAKHSTTVLEIAVSPLDFTLDGSRLRAHAKPEHPGVILSFESKHGNLRYACDKYRDWADNLRAIALTLESLRAVDRWGAVHDAEQYKGWERLAAPGSMSRDAARAFIDEHGGTFVEAAKRLHPDVGGEPQLFQRLMEARKVLEGAS
jgi:hypothetical protein